MADFLTLHEIVKKARENLDQGAWDYLIGGADTESALRRNRAGVESWLFKPRILNDVSQVDCDTELLGQPMRIPVVMPPIGSVQAFEAGGAASVAEATDEFGILQVLSSVCTPDFETLAAQHPGPRVYQLYLTGDEAWMDDIISRAIEAGYTGFCLTADTQTYSRRERDILKRYVPLSGRIAGGGDFKAQAKMTWDTVAHIKEKFALPLLIKGVGAAEDARRCVEMGVDVVWVSNHGGRQLDHTRACIDVLPEVVEAVAGKAPVVVDGGFMRGADVVKALCLGATAVGMGRFEGLALAAGGAPALLAALQILEHEIKTTMALAGANCLAQLSPDLLCRDAPLAPAHVLSAFPFLVEGY
ncbi:MAG: alpha-hydroxy-acid oxidizing protein [Pseudomonadaceae bacterium]|nr:alpha-hydroxy-acid oxidizing protein [Pseudomonadaceae bacterium]